MKKSQGHESNESNPKPIVLLQPGNPMCPVNTYKLYISKLYPKCDAFFQNTNQYYRLPKDKWYKNMPADINTIGNFLKTISELAGLSYIYTNHCIRGTTVSAMKCAGYSLQDIAYVLGHKNLETLKHYLDKPTLNDKENFADDLFKYTGNSNLDDSDMSDFKIPP